jgi:GntR family transcriptional repressor for pyruvate dehydrogenase complex
VATLADEVASMFASMHDPQLFLVHDINFHRALAAASGNPILASLVEMVSALYYERRRETAVHASERDHRDAAEMHRRIYEAIRAHDAERARSLMNAHLIQASQYQAQEEPHEPKTPASAASAPQPRRRRRRQTASH